MTAVAGETEAGGVRPEGFLLETSKEADDRIEMWARARMAMPKRIQRKRTKGWRMPEGVVYVGRPTRWGNPWQAEDAVERFRTYAIRRVQDEPEWLDPLRGRDLACWCRIYVPCHADTLLGLANR